MITYQEFLKNYVEGMDDNLKLEFFHKFYLKQKNFLIYMKRKSENLTNEKRFNQKEIW